MEDILSSIKRIIAEEGETTPGRGRRAGRPVPTPPSDDEVLELSNPMPELQPEAEPQSELQPQPILRQRPADAIRAEPARSIDRTPPAKPPVRPASPASAETDQKPERPAPPTPTPEGDVADEAGEDPIVSPDTVEATRGALDQLSRLLVKPEPRADGTLEGLVREMLRPMLRDWLDAQLPALVEEMVAREIDRIMAGRR